MSVVAPPRPPQTGDPLGGASYEALIEEARLRARRRRSICGGVAVLVVVAALALVSNRGGTPGSDGAHAHESDAPRLAAAPDPDDATALVAGLTGPGFVRLYGDGRVLQKGLGGDILERHLSPLGWNGVRSGAIDLTDFAVGYDPDVRESDWWVDPGGETYSPSSYGICPDLSVTDVGAVVNHLPPAVRAVLLDPPTIFEGPTAAECRKVTSDQALNLIHASDALDAGYSIGGVWYVGYALPDGMEFPLTLEPILPDGEPPHDP